MPTYAVTGKLGSGKTLACVGRIRDALIQGRPVATNLDIKLEKLVGKKASTIQLYRLPDKPTAADLYALGSGNDGYDEEHNGLLVLDECGTWFNAREWNDKDRRGLLDWLLHARKYGWDPHFIIQETTMMDKQARKSILEMVVYCRRLDRLTVPLLDPIYKAIFDKPMPRKKVHLGVVKYGDQPNAPVSERWWYLGRDLYPAYDTKQVFRDDYPHGLYQVLPPWYTHGRYMRPRDWRFVMRLTRIYLRQYSRVLMVAVAAVGGAAVAAAVTGNDQPQNPLAGIEGPITPEKLNQLPGVSVSMGNQDEPTQNEPEPESVTLAQSQSDRADPLKRWRGAELTGVAADADGNPIYATVRTKDGGTYSLDTIRAEGFKVKMPDKCSVVITDQETGESIQLHTSYCAELG
ncbi:zonular occludens toxin domain-containing protein [Halospina sp. K52047b]|uniref:zonular occludens toxin domain-containing protein n=1 Tax=Halospina sp. K52047b TaxID=2614160 RepID=UPI001249FF14|nr:zonular occludens toxin domain-containing protein [Halospina sp. K52047b]KAA8976912.1 assembly protein [Halospina sp. K52047b]